MSVKRFLAWPHAIPSKLRWFAGTSRWSAVISYSTAWSFVGDSHAATCRPLLDSSVVPRKYKTMWHDPENQIEGPHKFESQWDSIIAPRDYKVSRSLSSVQTFHTHTHAHTHNQRSALCKHANQLVRHYSMLDTVRSGRFDALHSTSSQFDRF